MTQFGSAAWPPSSLIRTDRLVLREAQARDNAVFMDLLGSAQVHEYLGGPVHVTSSTRCLRHPGQI